MKKIFCALLIITLMIPNMTILAAEQTDDLLVLKSTFTSEPGQRQVELMNECALPVYEDKSTREILPDGLQRIYGAITFDNCLVNDRYKFIGQCSVYNRSSENATLEYTQGSTKTTSWNVSTTVSGKTEVKNAFLAKIEATLGVTVGTSYTTQSSSTVTCRMTVRPNKTGYIDAYHKSGYASGYIRYDDYTPDGKWVKSGKLTISGHSIVKGSVHYDVYEE